MVRNQSAPRESAHRRRDTRPSGPGRAWLESARRHPGRTSDNVALTRPGQCSFMYEATHVQGSPGAVATTSANVRRYALPPHRSSTACPSSRITAPQFVNPFHGPCCTRMDLPWPGSTASWPGDRARCTAHRISPSPHTHLDRARGPASMIHGSTHNVALYSPTAPSTAPASSPRRPGCRIHAKQLPGRGHYGVHAPVDGFRAHSQDLRLRLRQRPQLSSTRDCDHSATLQQRCEYIPLMEPVVSRAGA